jgi:hypothetical protein
MELTRGDSRCEKMLILVVGVCCVGLINYVGVVADVWRQRLALSVGSN